MNGNVSSAIVAALVLTATAWGDAPVVYCGCTEGEYSGPGHYVYDVDSASYPMMEFTVGTNDLDPTDYINVSIPPGWDFAVEAEWMSHAHGILTYHGFVSPGPCWCLTAGRVRWWTEDPAYAIEFFSFSFDHPWCGEDVGWLLTTRREGPPPEYYYFNESWEAPVGMGMGPLHGPYAPGEWCWASSDCGADRYCFFADCAAETGVCLARPTECPSTWDPVCGCDGVTYDNPCYAAMAGASLTYHDACLIGDIDLDGDVDMADLSALLSAYGACQGDAQYNPAADLDGSGCVDLSDLSTLLTNYGTEV